ncbi:MAG: ABC transporter ATP-binding protein [Conexivisphaerales archaeon]
MQELLKVSEVRLQFYTRRGIYKALNGVQLELRKGEVFGIAGESGSGKSTLGLTIMGLLPRNAAITSGNVILDGKDIVAPLRDYASGMNGKFNPRKNEIIMKRLNNQLSEVRGKKVSMVFQDPMTSLNPVIEVGYQIAETMIVHQSRTLALRKLARAKATRSDLEEVLKVLRSAGDDEKKVEKLVTDKGLEGLDEQVLNIWRRKDLPEARKEKMILSLHSEKLTWFEKLVLNHVKENGKLGRWVSGIPLLGRFARRVLVREGYRKALELLSTLEVPNAEKVIRMYPHELSGGMRQRIVIAIALANNPEIVIMDEPTSALDVTVQAQILEFVRHLKNKFNTSFIFISHDLSVLSEVCDRIGIMYGGRIVEVAPTKEIFENPLHPYTKLLIAAIPTLEEKEIQEIGGAVPDMRFPPTGCMFNPRCPYVMNICRERVPEMIEVRKEHFVACYVYQEKR